LWWQQGTNSRLSAKFVQEVVTVFLLFGFIVVVGTNFPVLRVVGWSYWKEEAALGVRSLSSSLSAFRRADFFVVSLQIR
jgi:hypothetical protein